MTPWLAAPLLASYYLVLGVLACFGVHRLVLVWRCWSHRGRARPVILPPTEWPLVTVQLPLYNERCVVERLLDAVGALDYSAGRLEIQVLDDSTDETSALAAAAVERLRARGLAVEHLRRTHRHGFKAGALEAGLEAARGELIAVFDADFVPPPGFLTATVPAFADPAVGMVQTRWEHLNREASLLTRVQALLLDGHFAVEHRARHVAGCFFNFNGTAGIWRRQAIADAGGWAHDTLTEDLDLSYRAQLAGWRFVYLAEVAVPAELPADAASFKAQQRRWAKGSLQTARKVLPRLLSARLPWRVKLEACAHLTANLSYPLMVALSLLLFPAMVARRGGARALLLWLDAPLFVAATASVFTFYIASQVLLGRRIGPAARLLPAVMALGLGLAPNNARAALSGLRRRGGVFDRTPKHGSGPRAGPRRGLHRYRARRDPNLTLEGLLAAYLALCCAAASASGMWLALPFLALFLHGYAGMLGWSIAARLRA
jgi:cellulose synthase/poly-beta-1,6-N-acetylglucosamine synthase-like glycosyltransferase